ncbi:hypothetical protein NC651_025034 [Populus alba x Populus x berolinensis]|nr:hypothetical protein NC651_025034 [Populus alba x Populus x berolinensis]
MCTCLMKTYRDRHLEPTLLLLIRSNCSTNSEAF